MAGRKNTARHYVAGLGPKNMRKGLYIPLLVFLRSKMRFPSFWAFQSQECHPQTLPSTTLHLQPFTTACASCALQTEKHLHSVSGQVWVQTHCTLRLKEDFSQHATKITTMLTCNAGHQWHRRFAQFAPRLRHHVLNTLPLVSFSQHVPVPLS